MKAGFIFLLLIGIPAAIFLFFLGAEIVSEVQKERRKAAWKKARQNARWEVITNPTGKKVVVGIGRVARVKDQAETFDTTTIGTAYLDDPGGQMLLLDLQGQAHERAMTLNSL